MILNSSKTRRILTLGLLVGASPVAVLAGSGSADKSPPPAPAPAAEPDTLFGQTAIGRAYDDLKAAKDAAGIPLTFGAWHWWRVGTGGPKGDGYGIPGLRGTYYWSIDFDPKITLEGPNIQEIGLHTQIRLREEDKFRPFIDSQVWPWEAYAYMKTSVGTFKAGQIWKRFGLDWDGCFYGNVAYFDGFKLDPDLGASWEHTYKSGDNFKLDSFAQFFVREDGINGSLNGADAESSNLFREQTTGVLRLIPTWMFADQSSVAWGISGQVGNIKDRRSDHSDHTASAWETDLTYTNGPFKVFGEVFQNFGAINPTRYVSGGASDRITDFLVGAGYRTGPVTWRCNYSAGYDHNPGGKQGLFLPGATVALTKNTDLYIEYVKWTVDPNNAPKSEYENGMQFILNWRF